MRAARRVGESRVGSGRDCSGVAASGGRARRSYGRREGGGAINFGSRIEEGLDEVVIGGRHRRAAIPGMPKNLIARGREMMTGRGPAALTHCAQDAEGSVSVAAGPRSRGGTGDRKGSAESLQRDAAK